MSNLRVCNFYRYDRGHNKMSIVLMGIMIVCGFVCLSQSFKSEESFDITFYGILSVAYAILAICVWIGGEVL